MRRAAAVISPDGRVFEVSNRECLENNPFPSVKAWHDHVARKREEHLAEQERQRLSREKTKCPHCGHFGADAVNDLPL
jgi:CO dehydrogenase/acetyl-CoA synthase beta subunit